MISSKSQMSIVQGLVEFCSVMPAERWGKPGVNPSQVDAGVPVGIAVEAAKMAAQHNKTESIVTHFNKQAGVRLNYCFPN